MAKLVPGAKVIDLPEQDKQILEAAPAARRQPGDADFSIPERARLSDLRVHERRGELGQAQLLPSRGIEVRRIEPA